MKNKEDIKSLALELAAAGAEKKAEDIVLLDVDGLTSVADYFVVFGARNAKQAQSIADEIEDAGARAGLPVLHREGYRTGDWILIDFGDILCHVFAGDTREFFGLEALWKDAPSLAYEGD